MLPASFRAGMTTETVRGAAVVVDGLTAEQLRTEARRLLSSFKVPTVWRLLESDDDVPRGATGKVDALRLRKLLEEDG